MSGETLPTHDMVSRSSRSLGVCSTNTLTHPPVCHILATTAWKSWCTLCLGYKAQLHAQPMPLFSHPNASEQWVISFWSNLPYSLHHCLSFWQCPADHKKNPGLHSYPKFPVLAGHLSLPHFLFHSNEFLKRGKFSSFSPSAHHLPLPHPTGWGRKGHQEQSEPWGMFGTGAALSAVCCAQKALSGHQVVQDP